MGHLLDLPTELHIQIIEHLVANHHCKWPLRDILILAAASPVLRNVVLLQVPIEHRLRTLGCKWPLEEMLSIDGTSSRLTDVVLLPIDRRLQLLPCKWPVKDMLKVAATSIALKSVVLAPIDERLQALEAEKKSGRRNRRQRWRLNEKMRPIRQIKSWIEEGLTLDLPRTRERSEYDLMRTQIRGESNRCCAASRAEKCLVCA
ncbi:hypothetical protein OHC33_010145 [Knufia fluminis]|uniref:F-box domain-containing protein n=1 Tax=Knufia fluminis TaxID=191047 RepID=A0AAN8E8L0_9EURO|nr:hypothetical protein OHC33_010145 [Knufia fluminis]